jgi:hypothetical protein
MRHLEQQNALELTVRIGCPVLCEFCPQDILTLKSKNTRKRVLQAEDLRTIIANSSTLRPLRIVFAGFAEPFRVPHIGDLLRVCEADERVQRITVYTTGEGLTGELLEFMAGLRKLYPDPHAPSNRYLNFHVRPRSDYSLMKGARGDIWQRIPQIARLFPEARFVCVTDGVAPEGIDEMRRELRDQKLRLTTRALESRAGNVSSVNGRRLTYERVDQAVSCCKVRPATFMPVVLPDGSTYPCCNDYGRELAIGNLLTESWEELDFSHVRQLQKDPTSDAPCFRGCHLAEPQSGLLREASTLSAVWE